MKNDLHAKKINPNDDHIQIARWHVGEKQPVRKGQDLLDVNTSKITLTLTSEHDGFLHQLKREGQRVKIGDIFGAIYSDIGEIPAESPRASEAHTHGRPPKNFSFTRFSDAAHALIREHDLDEGLFAGMGLVTTDIVNQKIQMLTTEKSPLLPPVKSSPYRTQQTLGAKEIEIKQLQEGQRGLINSHLTVQFYARPLLEKLESLGRRQMSLLPIILHEFAVLAKRHPLFTAFYRDGEIHFYDEVTVGLALDTGNGLKVASIEKAADLTPVEWKEKITELALKDMRGQLTAEDLRSTTVTVTDLSSLDVLHFQPLINGAQSCILGIGGDRSMEDYPMTLTINFDHRVLTGREVAEFLQSLKNQILSYKHL